METVAGRPGVADKGEETFWTNMTSTTLRLHNLELTNIKYPKLSARLAVLCCPSIGPKYSADLLDWEMWRASERSENFYCSHTAPLGWEISYFVFKVGKPPINIVFFIYRVFNNGSYPIVFSINSYVSQYNWELYSSVRCTVPRPPPWEVQWLASLPSLRQGGQRPGRYQAETRAVS